MKLNQTFTYVGKSVEEVYANTTSEAFRSESCAKQHSSVYSFTVAFIRLCVHLVSIFRATPVFLPDFF